LTPEARAEGKALFYIIQANDVETAKASATYPSGHTAKYDTATELYADMVSLYFQNIG
jgi:hypothetical protein